MYFFSYSLADAWLSVISLSVGDACDSASAITTTEIVSLYCMRCIDICVYPRMVVPRGTYLFD